MHCCLLYDMVSMVPQVDAVPAGRLLWQLTWDQMLCVELAYHMQQRNTPDGVIVHRKYRSEGDDVLVHDVRCNPNTNQVGAFNAWASVGLAATLEAVSYGLHMCIWPTADGRLKTCGRCWLMLTTTRTLASKVSSVQSLCMQGQRLRMSSLRHHLIKSPAPC
jgi:hypothetical protein